MLNQYDEYLKIIDEQSEIIYEEKKKKKMKWRIEIIIIMKKNIIIKIRKKNLKIINKDIKY